MFMDPGQPYFLLEESPFGILYRVNVERVSGFTGSLMTEHLDAVLSLRKSSGPKWAIAGRNVAKLRSLVSAGLEAIKVQTCWFKWWGYSWNLGMNRLRSC